MTTQLKFCKACNTDTERNAKGGCKPCRAKAKKKYNARPDVAEQKYLIRLAYYHRNPEAFARLVEDVESRIGEPLWVVPAGLTCAGMTSDQRFKLKMNYHLSDLPRFHKLKADMANLFAMVL